MKIAIVDDYHGLSTSLVEWGGLASDVTVFRVPIAPEAVVDELRAFDVLCLMRERTPLPAGVIQQLPNLRLIVTTGMRNASIDLDAARVRGIRVCGTASRPQATSQLTMLLMLAAMRGLFAEVSSVRDGRWQSGAGRDLFGLTLGLVGLGKQGGAVAGLAQAFGMRVIAWSRNLTDARCDELGVTRADDLNSLLAESDVVSIHLVLSERTVGLMGAAELSRMKPDSLLVNTSRGPIVDERALLAALRNGRPAMAALDVYDQEPLPPDHPLRDRDLIDSGRLLLTPHIGYGSLQNYRRMYEETFEAVTAWLAGAPVGVIA